MFFYSFIVSGGFGICRRITRVRLRVLIILPSRPQSLYLPPRVCICNLCVIITTTIKHTLLWTLSSWQQLFSYSGRAPLFQVLERKMMRRMSRLVTALVKLITLPLLFFISTTTAALDLLILLLSEYNQLPYPHFSSSPRQQQFSTRHGCSLVPFLPLWY